MIHSCRTSIVSSALRSLSSAGGPINLLPSASNRTLDKVAFSFKLCLLARVCSCRTAAEPPTSCRRLGSKHFQPLHGLFHFGCELEHQADSFGRLLAFPEGGGLVEDFGPLRRVPAQRFGRQKFTALLVVENVAKSEIHLERSFQAFGGRSQDVRPTELETSVALQPRFRLLLRRICCSGVAGP